MIRASSVACSDCASARGSGGRRVARERPLLEGRPSMTMTTAPEGLFWQLAAELQRDDPRAHEGTIMNGRCLRVGTALRALVDDHAPGLVGKLPRQRVAELLDAGVGKPFGPAGKIFKGWLAVPKPDRRRWRELLMIVDPSFAITRNSSPGVPSSKRPTVM